METEQNGALPGVTPMELPITIRANGRSEKHEQNGKTRDVSFPWSLLHD